MSNDIIATDLQSQEVDSGLVELFELELNSNTTLFFYSGYDADLDNVRFHPINQTSKNNVTDANSYAPLPIQLDGIESQSDGATNRPTVTFANVGALFRGILQDESFTFDDLVGKKLTRRRTFQKYLVGGSDASTPFEFPIASYIIDRVSTENSVVVSFELAPPFDVNGVKLPGRIVVGKYCSWVYQGYANLNSGGCFWTADSKALYNTTEYDAFFDSEDRPLVSQTTLASAATAYSAGTSYAQDAFVSYSGGYWRSEVSSNNTTPSATNTNWKRTFGWTTYSASTTYSAGAYVKHNNHIWKAALSNNVGQTPQPGSLYWVRQDYCSKTLAGCKCRFQFKPTAQGLPSAAKETFKPLPFGAFPGSGKFK